MDREGFKAEVWERGRQLYREMPWREDTRPYYVLVSELMLQQTQVERVVPKFQAFTARFPNEKSLAQAPLADVLLLWNGLGYNRRAKFLWQTAQKITTEFSGKFPSDYDSLMSLPGVGKNTAGAILAYAFNQPALFIETNVRTVFFHHFFPDDEMVDDKQLLEILEKVIDTKHPREFYWALMDYGAYLKKNRVRNVARSKHYKKQSALKGSVREVRGQIIRSLLAVEKTVDNLQKELGSSERFQLALRGLRRDGLVQQKGEYLHLTK